MTDYDPLTDKLGPSSGGTDRSETARFTPLPTPLDQPSQTLPDSPALDELRQNGTIASYLATAGTDNFRLADESIRAAAGAAFHWETFGQKLQREVAEWREKNQLTERTPTLAARLPLSAAKGFAGGIGSLGGGVRALTEDHLDPKNPLYDPIRGFGAWVQEKAAYAGAYADPNATPDWEHVHGLYGFADWLGNKVAEGVGYMAPMVAASATPAGWGGVATVGMAQGVGQARDALEGAGVSGSNLKNYTLGAGLVLGALNASLGAQTVGALSEAAKAKLARYVGARLAVGAAERSFAGDAARAVGSESLKAGAAMAFQDAFTLAAVAAADGEQGEAALDRAMAALADPRNLARIAESGVVGAAFGATLGVPKATGYAAHAQAVREYRKMSELEAQRAREAEKDVQQGAEGTKEPEKPKAAPAEAPVEFEDEPAHALPGQEEAGKGRWREDDAQGGKLVWEPEDAAQAKVAAATRAKYGAYAESLRRQRAEFERELGTLTPEETTAPEAPQFEDLAPLTPEEQALAAEREDLARRHGALKEQIGRLNREGITAETAEHDRLLTAIDAELARHNAEIARRGPKARKAYSKRNAEILAELQADRDAVAADRDAIASRTSDARASEALRLKLAGIGDRLRSITPQAEEIAARAERLAEIETEKAEHQKARRTHEETLRRNETRAGVARWVQRKMQDLDRQIAEAEARAAEPKPAAPPAETPPTETPLTGTPDTTQGAGRPPPRRRKTAQDRAEADRRHVAELLAALRDVAPERAAEITRDMPPTVAPEASIMREGRLPAQRDRILMDELFRALQERAPDRAAEFAERFAAELAGPEPETGPAGLSPMPVDEPYHRATAAAIRQGVLDAVDADLSLPALAKARARRDITQAAAEFDAQPYGRTMGEFVDALRRVAGYELAATGSARAGYGFPVELVTGIRAPADRAKTPGQPPTDADFLGYLDAAARTGTLTANATLYHGLTQGELSLSQLRDGAVIEAPGLIQASPRPTGGAGVVHLRVTLPRGETGFVIDKGRGGVILPAGTMLRIKGIAKQAWRVNPFGEAGRGKGGKTRSGLIADAELVTPREADQARAEAAEGERLAAEQQAADVAAAEAAKRERVSKAVAEAQKPAEAKPDVRKTFYDILESKARLDGDALAKKLELGDREFRALIDESVKAGWLLKTDKGKFRRVPANRRPARPDQAAPVSEAIAAPEAVPATPPPTAPRSLLDILKGPHVRKDWAKVLGVSEAELQPMIDEAVAKGWLRRDKRGIVRRNPKGWESAETEAGAPPPRAVEQPAPRGETVAAPEPARPAERPVAAPAPAPQPAPATPQPEQAAPVAELARTISDSVGGLSRAELAAVERAIKARKEAISAEKQAAPPRERRPPSKPFLAAAEEFKKEFGFDVPDHVKQTAPEVRRYADRVRKENERFAAQEKAFSKISVSVTHSPAMEQALAMVDRMFAIEEPRAFSPEFEAVAPEVSAAIVEELRRILPPDVAVRVRDAVRLQSGQEVSGAYSPSAKLIELSLKLGPDGMLRKGWHESVHALWSSFTDQERTLLTERARKVVKDVHPDYDALYRAAAAEHGLDGAEADAFVHGRIDQERVAKMAETWADGRATYGTKIGALFERIVNTLKAIGNALRGLGFHTVDDVFQKMFSGEVGARGASGGVDLMGQQASLFGRIRNAFRGRGQPVHGVAADAGEPAVQEGDGKMDVAADPGARRGEGRSGAGGEAAGRGASGVAGDAQTAAARQGIGGGAVAARDPSWIRRINDLTFASQGHRERARAMGFDVERPFYHGSANAGFGEFIRGRMGGAQSRLGPGIYMTNDPHIAGGKPGDSRYSPEGYTEGSEGRKSPGVYKLVHRVKNPFNIEKNRISGDWLPDEYASYSRGENITYEEAVSLVNSIDRGRVDKPPANRIVRDALRRQGFDGMLDPNDEGSFGKGTAKHSTLVAFDPNQVRSITAEFDPERSGTGDLLAALDDDQRYDAAALARKNFPDAPTHQPRAGTDAPTTSLREIMDDFRQALGLTVRFGRLDPRLLAAARAAGGTLHGQFSSDTGVIRLRDQRDYDTNAHEAGHHLHDEYAAEINALMAAHAAEMQGMAAAHALAPANPREQFAEFFRRYMTNPTAAERLAPNFFADFEAQMDALDPRMFTELQRLQDAYQDWIAAPSATVAQSEIVYHQTRNWWRRFRDQAEETSFGRAMSWQLDKLYTFGIDELHPLKVARDRLLDIAQQNLGREVTLKAANDFYKLFRMVKGAYAQGHVDITEGVRGYHQIDPDGPSLRGALETALGGPGRGRWDPELIRKFDSYLAGRRVIQEYARFFAGELEREPDKQSLGTHQQAVASLEAENPMFPVAAQQVYDFLAALLRKQRDAGFIKPEVYQELIQRRDYVPLMRHMENFGDYAESFSQGRTTAGGRNERGLLRQFRGSDRDILSPIQSIAQRAYDASFAIARNDAFRALAHLAQSAGRGAGEIAEIVPESIGARDEMEVVHFWEGGRRRALKLHDGELGAMMLDAITSIGGRATSFWTELAALPARAVRAGVTVSPDFIVSNFVRDQIATWVNTESFTPFGTGARGAFSNLTLNQWAKRYGSFGGISGGAITDELQMRVDRDIQRLRTHGQMRVEHALNPLKAYRKILETSESSTRIGLFEASYRRARADGMTDYEALVEASYVSRDVLDFDRHGSGMDLPRKIIPFMNASLQGLDRYIRALRGREDRMTGLRDIAGTILSEGQRPADSLSRQAWVKSIVPLGIVSLALSAWYADDPEFDEIGESIRTTHWLFKAGQDSNGKSVWIRVPKPFEVAAFADVLERAFDYAYKGDTAAMGKALRSVVDLSTPALNAPAFFLPIELAFNHNMHFGGPIVKDESLPPDMQYDAHTSQLAKRIGATIGVAPSYVDHVVGSLSGSLGRSALGASNALAGPVAPATVDTPFARRFLTDQNRGSETKAKWWEVMGRSGGQFTQALTGYQWALEKDRDPVAAQERLDALPDEERVYAIMMAHGDATTKQMHPLYRAQTICSVAGQLQKEINLRGAVDLKAHVKKGDLGERVQISREDARLAIDILSDLQVREYSNALKVVGVSGWAHRPVRETEGVLKELEAAAPAVAQELHDRLSTKRGREKVFPFADVVAAWPHVRADVLANGAGAELKHLRP